MFWNKSISCTLYHTVPVSYQIDIRKTKFSEKFTSSENLICCRFVKQATDNMQIMSIAISVRNVVAGTVLLSLAVYLFFFNLFVP